MITEDCVWRAALGEQRQLNVQVIPGENCVSGIAVVGSEVFVARHGASHIDVYSNSTNNYGATRRVKISDSILDYPRLAACSHHNCLYVSSMKKYIHRVKLDDQSISKWSVKLDVVSGLSVANNYNLLLTVHSPARILEYTPEGRLMREIKLDDSLIKICHCIQLSTGQYVVSQLRSPSRVCIVDDSGHIIKSYGGPAGAGVGQLCGPVQLAVDKHDHVFVADYGNDRIVLLSPELAHLGYIQTPGHKLSDPMSLHLDEANRHLFVGEYSGRVVVVSVND